MVSEERRCYVCFEEECEARERRFVSVCSCSDNGSMTICKQCFVALLSEELQSRGESSTFTCAICKTPYRLTRLQHRNRCSECAHYVDRCMTMIVLVSFAVGCMVVLYILACLIALLSRQDEVFRFLVGGDRRIVFRVAEVFLLFTFITGSCAILVSFCLSGVRSRIPRRWRTRCVARVFDISVLDRQPRTKWALSSSVASQGTIFTGGAAPTDPEAQA